MSNTEARRAAFEAAYVALHEWDSKTPQFDYDDQIDLYSNEFVQMAWWAWQAATEQATVAEQVPLSLGQIMSYWNAYAHLEASAHLEGFARAIEAAHGIKVAR